MSDQFIGLDVGGTKIASATLCDGSLSEGELVETAIEDRDTLIKQLVAAVEELRDGDVRAVGVGVPSVVDFATGRIRASVNIPLEDVPLRELLTERVGLPVFVDNDASCAALAEAFEDGKFTCPDLVMFTIGTGVGGGTVLGGSLYRGATGAAPEIGHQIIGLDLSEGDESSDSDKESSDESSSEEE